MSGKVMGAVWDLELPAPQMMILLAMADHADHNGEHIYPSMDLIAWKTSYSIRQVRRIVKQLVSDEILVLVKRRGGGTNEYKIDLSKAKKKAPFTRGDILSRDIAMSGQEVTKRHIRGDIAVSPEPSLEPSLEPITSAGTSGYYQKPPDEEPVHDTVTRESEDTETDKRELTAKQIENARRYELAHEFALYQGIQNPTSQEVAIYRGKKDKGVIGGFAETFADAAPMEFRAFLAAHRAEHPDHPIKTESTLKARFLEWRKAKPQTSNDPATWTPEQHPSAEQCRAHPNWTPLHAQYCTLEEKEPWYALKQSVAKMRYAVEVIR